MQFPADNLCNCSHGFVGVHMWVSVWWLHAWLPQVRARDASTIDKMANAGTYAEQDIKDFVNRFGVSLGCCNDAQVECIRKVVLHLMTNKEPADARATFASLTLDGEACGPMLDSFANAGIVEGAEIH